MEVEMWSAQEDPSAGLGLNLAAHEQEDPEHEAHRQVERANLRRTFHKEVSDLCSSVGYQDTLRRRAEKAERESILRRYREGERGSRPSWKIRLQNWISSGYWITSLMLVILAESVHSWLAGEDPTVLEELLAIAVSLAFLVDVGVRMYIFGPAVFLRKLWNIFDLVVVFLTVSITVLLFCGVTLKTSGRSIIWLVQLMRVVRLFRMTTLVRRLCPAMRRITGENKRRYVDLQDDFDLDLTYITPRLMGMSVPAAGAATWLYRNPRQEVVRFFETFYAGHYLIINACPEHPYPATDFGTGRVEPFDVEDHTPPLIEQFITFLHLAEAWRCAGPEANVMAVHCRGGKGRTGSFCCVWLMYTREAEDAQDALNYFAMRRTDIDSVGRKKKVQGVETPSQVRYVEYMGAVLHSQQAFSPAVVSPPAPSRVQLLELRLRDVLLGPPQELALLVHDRAKRHTALVVGMKNSTFNLEPAIVEGEILIEVYGRGSLGPDASLLQSCWFQAAMESGRRKGSRGEKPACLFFFYFHTAFLDGEMLHLEASDVDKGKGMKRKINDDGFLQLSYRVL